MAETQQPPRNGRIAMAQSDLDHARQADLAAASKADLIRLVERLRGSLYDMLRLVEEITTPDQTCP
jgi:hypothetical protein